MPSAPPIVLTAFSGEQPRIIPRLMPDTSAQSARDTRLDDGGLTPMRDSVFVDTVPATSKTIYLYKGNWIGWNAVVDVAPGPVAEDRLYYTGDGAPKMLINTTVYPLAVPRPATALTAALAGTGTGDVQSRLYVYTYVTNINGITEESEPSPASNEVLWKPGNTVDLTGFLAAPAPNDRGIATQRIYRAQTGSAGTYFYLIHERPVSAAPYNDNIAVTATAEPCPSVSYNAPPAELEGLIALPNGMMAAFAPETPGGPKKRLYFSEPYKPHAWPEKYVLTMDSEIVGLGAMGTSMVVATRGQPYFVTGTLPENMIAHKIEQNLPCINKRSIADLGYAIAYASHEGLVVCRADGSMGIATGNIFNREKWEDANPQTMIGAQLGGRYVAFYSRTLLDGTVEDGAGFIDLNNQPPFLFRSAIAAEAVRYDVPTSALYYKPPGVGEVRQIDADNAGRKSLYWRSKEFVLPYPENYGAFMVDSDVTITPADSTAYDAEVAAIKAANLELIHNGGTYVWDGWEGEMDGWPTVHPSSGSIGGDIDALPLNEVPLNGDILAYLPYRVPAVMTVGIYCDKKLVAYVLHSNRSARLPSGFKGRTWEIDIFTNQRIHRMTMAKTMDDLKRTP